MRRPLWQRAASFAARAHKHDTRDDDETPYFSHPARVAMTVRHVFGCDDERAIAAAFLHDTIENTDEGYDRLEEEFGADVADMVAALTKTMSLPSRERDNDYWRRLKKANWRARLVKLADVYDNFTDTLLGLKEGRGDVAKKARDMMDLARDDAAKHPETARALGALRVLLKTKRLKQRAGAAS